MQPVVLNVSDVSTWVARLWWPTLRVGGFVLAAPIASENTIPRLIKIVMSVALAFLMAPMAQVPAGLSIFSAAGMLAGAQEVLIGVSIGMVVQLAFEALTFAGQTISLTMGLGFATLVDPQRGAQTTVIGQMFMIIGVLAYLAVNGLTPGDYTVSIMDYANFAIGPTLGAGFTGGALTGGTYLDATEHNRDSHWAFDILGVEAATNPTAQPTDGTPAVPEPSSIVLLGSGLLGVANLARKRLFA